MTRYIIRRLLTSIPLLIGTTIIVFVLTEAMPGDYVAAMMPPDASYLRSEEQLHEMREALGLNKPAYERYFLWLGEVARGNLGYSLASGQPVIKEILQRLPNTLQLTVTSLIFGVFVGVTLGIISAVKQYSWLDQLLTLLGFIWVSTPGFVFAIFAIVVFSLKLQLFPTLGASPLGETGGLLTRLHHLILPASVLGLGSVATFMRYTRSSFLDVIRQEYITVARAKGLAERVILTRHALRNALIPVLTMIGLQIPWLLGGSIVIETIFVWPGMGSFTLNAIRSRDYALILGINFVAAVAVLLGNLITDIAYAVVDPRVSYE